MTRAEWRCHEEPAQFVEAVAADVSAIAERAVEARGAGLLALPGGSTPRPIFRRLAEASLPWEALTLLPTDDRLVGAGSDLSNARLLEEGFGDTGARIVAIASDEPDVARAGDAADNKLRELPWPPDLVWLGMGEDGHTASIFAGPDLESALHAPAERRAVGVRPDPLPAEAPVPRVTLTRASIAGAGTVLITITGERKKTLLEGAIQEGDKSNLPIGRVLGRRQWPVTVHWCPA